MTPPPKMSPPEVPPPAPLPLPQQLVVIGYDSRAVTSLVLGVVALLLSWVPFINALSLVGGVLSVALGALVLRRQPTRWPTPPSSRRLAVAGTCCGAAALVVVLALAALFFGWVWAMEHGYATRLT